MAEVRWMGAVIVVYGDNSWAFHRCCRCGRQLTDPESRRRGFGPDCADEPETSDLVERERTRDRIRMRFDLARRRARERQSLPG